MHIRKRSTQMRAPELHPTSGRWFLQVPPSIAGYGKSGGIEEDEENFALDGQREMWRKVTGEASRWTIFEDRLPSLRMQPNGLRRSFRATVSGPWHRSWTRPWSCLSPLQLVIPRHKLTDGSVVVSGPSTFETGTLCPATSYQLKP